LESSGCGCCGATRHPRAFKGGEYQILLVAPLLESGRQREDIDPSKVVLTHHNLRNLGRRAMPLGDGDTPPLPPITDAGSGSVQEKERRC
jgi:hypothetical protein